MTDQDTDQNASERYGALTDGLPSQEKHQPDPALQMSTGTMDAGSMALLAVAAAVILGIVFYGLNSPTEPGGATPPKVAASSAAHSPSSTAAAPRPTDSPNHE